MFIRGGVYSKDCPEKAKNSNIFIRNNNFQIIYVYKNVKNSNFTYTHCADVLRLTVIVLNVYKTIKIKHSKWMEGFLFEINTF